MKIRKSLILAIVLLLSTLLTSCYCDCSCNYYKGCKIMISKREGKETLIFSDTLCNVGTYYYNTEIDNFVEKFIKKYDTDTTYIEEKDSVIIINSDSFVKCGDDLEYYEKQNYECECYR